MPSTRTHIRRESSASSASGPITLPPELLAESARRLGWAALIYAGMYALSYLGPHVVLWLTMPGHVFFRPSDLFAVFSIALGIAMFVLVRRDVLPPQRLLDVGLVFEVVASLGISVAEFSQGGPRLETLEGGFMGIPWECVWIILFPLLAPNTPRKILVASIAAATTGPVVIFLGAARGVAVELPPLMIAMYFLFSTYLCAIAAYLAARVLHRYGIRWKKAREIGSYELLTKLGEGGMGEVWVGRHRMLARPAAVKLIRPEFLGDSHHNRVLAIKRFEREARETAALRSTHTVEIYDFGVTEDGAFYYVMELLEGLTFDAMVRRFGPLEPRRAIHLLRQVCHSLGEAHARGLIHRDIKPANIFASRLGPDCDFVKVLDFGLVKHATDPERATVLTQQGITAGTPAYMAPEVALGQSDLDGRADIYALGCVGYWLLTGHPVFEADTPMAAALAHVRDAPVPPSERSEIEIPASLDAVILSCLAKDRADRPQTAAILAGALAEVPVAPWTADEAQQWWALHGPQGTTSAVVDPNLSPAAIVYAER